jgi:hypothetical protein
MNIHPSEQQLETLILEPECLSAEARNALRQHIEKCVLCREHWDRLKLMYRSIEDELRSEPTRRDREFAERLLASEERLALPERGVVRRKESGLSEVLETYAEVIEPYRRTALERFVRWVRIHPVRFATASAFSLAALALLTITLTRGTKDTNPMYAEVKNAVLRVYNKEGEVLWSKPVPRIPDGSTRFGFNSPYNTRFVTVDDIDGNGRNVVLVTGLTVASQYGIDSLFCFEDSGKLRWKIGAGKFATFGKKGVGLFTEAGFVSHVVVKSSERPPRLFTLVSDIAFSPAKLIEIDTQTGRELHAYHHRGGLSVLLQMDIDNDGKQELVVAGVNDGYDRACISILEPDKIDGHAPVPSELLPLENMVPAKEKYYVLLPVSDLGRTRGHTLYNSVGHAQNPEDNLLIVSAQEPGATDSTTGVSPAVVYVFGESMKVVNVTGDDNFLKIYQKYFPHEQNIKLNLAYWNALRDSVLYWDGEKFVHTPTMNKRYLDTQKVLF